MRIGIGVLFTVFSILVNKGYGQINAAITGVVTDTSGMPVHNVYVKISQLKNNRIIAYFNTGKDSVYHYPFVLPMPDSITVAVTHIGFAHSTQAFFVGQSGTIQASFRLKAKSSQLGEVVVNAQTMWRRGDTTNFKLQAFKMGDERRLVDIIINMPGFELDQNGNLLFNKKAVEKVTIDGEELFADRVKLMVNNFPAYAVDIVQALENQASNPILKGISNEKKVVVNLVLNEKKMKAAFGNGEAGIGTLGRWYIDPVIFSLWGKAKMGLIGHAGNIGRGTDMMDQAEKKPQYRILSEQLMMSSRYLQSVGNFSASRYIKNRRIAPNLQINLPLSRHISHSLEISMVDDRQSQQSNYHSLLFSDTGIIKREERNDNIVKPRLLNINNHVKWRPDSSRLLHASLVINKDNTQAYKTASITQQQQLHQLSSELKNNWQNIDASLDYTQRTQSGSAWQMQMIYSNFHLAQASYGVNPQWYKLLQVPEAYDKINQDVVHSGNWLMAKAERFTNRNSKSNKVGLQWKWQQGLYHNRFFLNSSKAVLKDTAINDFSAISNYSIQEWNVTGQNQLGNKKFPVTLNTMLGWFSASAGMHEHAAFNFPVFNVELNASKRNSGKNNFIKFQLVQKNAELVNLLPQSMPVDIITFRKNNLFQKPLRQVNSSYTYSIAWPKSLTYTNFSIDYSGNITSPVILNNYNSLLQVMVNELVSKYTNDINLSSTTTFNKMKKKRVSTGTIGINLSQYLLQHDEQLVRNSNVFVYVLGSVKRNITSTYFIHGDGKFFYRTNLFSKALAYHDDLSDADLRLKLRQRYTLGRHLNVILSSEAYFNNLVTKASKGHMFMDAEINYHYQPRRLHFNLLVQNLTNQQYFSSGYNAALFQRLYSIPLVRRNVLLSVKYEL